MCEGAPQLPPPDANEMSETSSPVAISTTTKSVLKPEGAPVAAYTKEIKMQGFGTAELRRSPAAKLLKIAIQGPDLHPHHTKQKCFWIVKSSLTNHKTLANKIENAWKRRWKMVVSGAVYLFKPLQVNQ